MLKKLIICGILIIILNQPLNIFSQITAFTNNGRLFIGQKNTEDSTTLFIQGNYLILGDTVSIIQEGKTILTGDFINNITDGNGFQNSTGIIEFRGNSLQTIRGTANKTLNYLNFPDLRINNRESVHLIPDMGMEMMNLDLVMGRLVLESSEDTSNTNRALCAHLLLKTGGTINYNLLPSDIKEKGIIEVDLSLGNNFLNGKIIGFTPPFKRIYSDYFMFNFMSRPSPAGLFGDSGKLIISPLVPMNAGEGYLIGQGITQDENYYRENLNEEWPGAEFNDRATDYFRFARYFMPPSISKFVTASDKFTGEELNISDISLPLTTQGFHYVGNPFTTSLDMSTFLQETSAIDQWGVTRGSDGQGEVRNSFYVISGGQGTYQPQNSKKFKFNVSYLLGQLVGGTLDYDGNPSFEIAPMQLFIIGKNTNENSNFIIPESARTHGLSYFLKSEKQTSPIDELMLEIVDTNTKGYDRLCVVFRENASLLSNDPYDASKIFNETRGVSQIFTQSSDNKKMITNVISPETQSLEMYLSPSDETQVVTISAYRLYSLESVKNIILEDKQTNIRTNLRTNPSYSFISSPSDPVNRFLLHFSKEWTDIEYLTSKEQEISIYAYQGIIYINELNEKDQGSILTVNDSQGRIIYKGKINEIPQTRINKSFEDGIYITKVTGQRQYVAKTIIKNH